MQESYKYFAFISFQSADAKEALWVQKAIENYRLPTAVSKTRSLPKRMRPCFCYLNDINLSEELMMELKQRMEQSEYLIVICSPRSAKSSFVNGGIDYFVQLGRRDRIIPLIVDGLPYSGDPETECFPEALRRHFPKSADPMQDHQILGVNVNEEGAGSRRWKRQRAVLRKHQAEIGVRILAEDRKPQTGRNRLAARSEDGVKAVDGGLQRADGSPGMQDLISRHNK